MIAEWTQDSTSLLNQVSEWSHLAGWQVEAEITYVDVPNSADALEKQGCRIITPEGRLHLEPVGRRADGKLVFELYAWPTLVRVRLVQASEPDSWQVVTDSGIPFHWNWNRENFVRLVHDLQVLP